MADAAVAPGAERRFAFIFGMASGHINPSFPVARRLVELGHEVHYLCREQMREAIEDTGAVFHSDVEQEPELYEGREAGLMGALESLKKEHGLEDENLMVSWAKLTFIQLELMLPGVIRWLKAIRADAVMYCPMMNLEAAYGARALGIPSVALLTTAGPGSIHYAMKEIIEKFGSTIEEIRDLCLSHEPHLAAVRRINSAYGLSLRDAPNYEPFGKLDVLKDSFVTLVTTCEDLQDPMTPEVERAYVADAVRFEAVGALLDKEGARRAAGHKYRHDEAAPGAAEDRAASVDGVLARVRAARAAGRQVVLVSMGTVITGDSPEMGWDGRLQGPDGTRRGLTGKQLCHGAWGGAFDAFGTEREEEGPLLVVALGPQPQALGELRPPANAVCVPVVPQVDVLKSGVDLFLTHGGQNSFTEALASGTSVVVCPGFGDQHVNARKAEALGVGAHVPRPDPDEGDEAAAAAQYRRDVARALHAVFGETAFREKAAGCKERLARAGGVGRAVEWMLAAADAKPGNGDAKAAEAAAAGAGGLPAAAKVAGA